MLAALALASLAGGCAVSEPLGSWLGRSDKTPAAPEVTGTIKSTTVTSNGGLPPEADLAYAKAALADVLNSGTPTVSARWENPKTGARGTVTPIASNYEQDGVTCRDFLASYLKAEVEAWMRGEACRAKRGAWVVKSLKPWQRS